MTTIFPENYLQRIMSSPGWSGSIVIEVHPEGRTEVWWRGTDSLGPDAVGPTVLDALAQAADDATS